MADPDLQDRAFAPPIAELRQPSKGKSWLPIIALLGLGLCVSILAFAALGAKLIESDICSELERDREVATHLGKVLDCGLVWGRTVDDARVDVSYYELKGELAAGVAILHTRSVGPDETEVIVSGTLKLESGRVIPLRGRAP